MNIQSTLKEKCSHLQQTLYLALFRMSPYLTKNKNTVKSLQRKRCSVSFSRLDTHCLEGFDHSLVEPATGLLTGTLDSSVLVT